MSLLPSAWLRVLQPRDRPWARLICFPHSGGGAQSYAAWAELLGERVEVVAVCLPGRNERLGEPGVSDLGALTAAVADALEGTGMVAMPYALFGHSFGSVVAYEVALELGRRVGRAAEGECSGRPLAPLHLFASAHAAPAAVLGSPPAARITDGDDDAFLERVAKWGFLPRELLDDESLRSAVLPALRADISMYESYRGRSDVLPSCCSVSALGGKGDSVAAAELAAWARHSGVAGEPDLAMFDGGHFYLASDPMLKAVGEHLRSRIDTALGRLPRSVLRGPDAPYLRDGRCCWEMLQQNAAAHPGAPAIVDVRRGTLSYARLWELVRRVGAQLAPLVTEPGMTVGMMLPHSTDYVAGMFAIWAAGGCFLVLERHHPPEMLVNVCATCDPHGSGLPGAVLITSELQGRLPSSLAAVPRVVLDQGWDEAPAPSWEPQRREGQIDHRAVLMTTSGTSGVPKLVECSQRHYTIGMLSRTVLLPYNGEPFSAGSDREACSVMFVWEAPRSVVQGQVCVVIPEEVIVDAAGLIDFLAEQRATRILTTPSLAGAVCDVLECPDGAAKAAALQRSLRDWLWMGEVVTAQLARRFQTVCPKVQPVNAYSTWEGLDTAILRVGPRTLAPFQRIVPVGAPHDGVVAVVVDPETREPQPYGVQGELFTTGPQLSSGYAMSPGLTAERFVPLPAAARAAGVPADAVWYKSGDAAVLRPGGVIELQGRIDSTVKIRGFKVGLAFVEAAIAEVEGVGVGIVVPTLDGETGQPEALCAVLAPAPGGGLSFPALVERVRGALNAKLPRWAAPAFYLPVQDAIPAEALRQGGESKKLNRRAVRKLYTAELRRELREARAAAGDRKPQLQHAAGSLEATVGAAWAAVLGMEPGDVDPEGNFFEMGGHSLLATRLTQDLQHKAGVRVTVLDLYEHASLSALLAFIHRKQAAAGGLAPQPARRPAAGGRRSNQVAVIGMAGRFPGAASVDEFWDNLRGGKVSVTRLTDELLRAKGVPEHVVSHPDYVRAAYTIDDADKFDARFFGIGRSEAVLMDPQHRVFIEAAWHAVEHAGYAPRSGFERESTRVGVWAAAGIDGYMIHHLEGEPLKDPLDPGRIFLGEVGSEKDYIASRVSYLLNLRGPSMSVGSACSSGLVAVAQACQAIAFGECDLAIAGASSVSFPNLGLLYQEGHVNSRDGLVRPLDEAASGTVFGDGVGAVVLKGLEEAERDGDTIWGVICGFGTSNDGGRKAGYAAPAASGQADAVGKALDMSNVDLRDIGYVELHATGTLVGDGIETRGLREAWAARLPECDDRAPWCALGSVKGNIAHANCAAGVTGLIKTLLMLRHQELAPTANFARLNAKCDLSGSPFYVGAGGKWEPPQGGGPRVCGVSSFGIGGTNAHLVLREHRADPPAPAPADGPHVLVVSAKTVQSLQGTLCGLAEGMRRGGHAAGDAAHTLAVGREHFPLRRAVVVGGEGAAAAAALSAAAAELSTRASPRPAPPRPPAVAFLFPGQGSQYVAMARGLYQALPVFRRELDACAERLAQADMLGRDLRTALFADPSPEAAEAFLSPTALQPALFATEYALAALLISLGVEPRCVAGHSIGEYAAAAVSGLLPLDGALRAIAARAVATERAAAGGAMLSLGVPESDAAALCEASAGAGGLWVSALNSPVHTVVSGTEEAVRQLESEARAKGLKATRLHVTRAFHSPMMAAPAAGLRRLQLPAAGQQRCPCASNVSGQWLQAEQAASGGYWADQMERPVRWRDCAGLVTGPAGAQLCVEVGPGNALSILTAKCNPGGGVVTDQCMRHARAEGVDDLSTLAELLGRLWERGVAVDWGAWQRELGCRPRRVPLPGYSFERTSHWRRPEASIYVATAPGAPRPAPPVQPAERPAAPHPAALVRFGAPRPGALLRIYCLPFAGGSARAFERWAAPSPAVEFVALELPGRGGRADEPPAESDAADREELRRLAEAVRADAAGCPIALCGLSMGGLVAAELAGLLAGCPLLGVIIAGRAPPRAAPPPLDLSDASLDRYSLAPEAVRAAPAWKDYFLPLLRGDLAADSRAEGRCAAAPAPLLPVPVALMCGTTDTIAPHATAPQWGGYCSAPPELRYFPGGHEFLTEAAEQLSAAAGSIAAGWLQSRRLAELAQLAAAASPQPQAPPPPAPAPLYAVRWEPVPQQQQQQQQQPPGVAACSPLPPWSPALAAALRARALVGYPCASRPPPRLPAVGGEPEAWDLIRWLQGLVGEGGSAEGRLVLVLPQTPAGGMAAGASKAVAMELPELEITRVWVSGQPPAAGEVLRVVARHPGESDLALAPDGAVAVLRLQPVPAPPQHAPPQLDPEASYLLTGATGGVGTAVVRWLCGSCGLRPAQVVLIARRAVQPPVPGVRVAVVSDISDPAALCSSAELRGLQRVGGVLHLAGALADATLMGQTEAGLRQCVQPKAGGLQTLLAAARELRWAPSWVIAFSSTSSLFGYPGQANYCAANGFVDSLAQWGPQAEAAADAGWARVVSVAWGPWGEAGMARAGTKAHALAVKEGDRPMPSASALLTLGEIMRRAARPANGDVLSSVNHWAVCDVDWRLSPWRALPSLRTVPAAAAAVAAAAATAGRRAEATHGGPLGAGASGIAERVADWLAGEVGAAWADVADSDVAALGLDSLDTVQLRNAFQKAFGPAPLSLFSRPNLTLRALRGSLVEHLGARTP